MCNWLSVQDLREADKRARHSSPRTEGQPDSDRDASARSISLRKHVAASDADHDSSRAKEEKESVSSRRGVAAVSHSNHSKHSHGLPSIRSNDNTGHGVSGGRGDEGFPEIRGQYGVGALKAHGLKTDGVRVSGYRAAYGKVCMNV